MNRRTLLKLAAEAPASNSWAQAQVARTTRGMSSPKTPARKLAAMAEIYNVKTAWHGPGDVSPIGHAANVGLDLACYNFGIQEYVAFDQATREVFQGTLVAKDGNLCANEAPGWGIEVDEKAAAKLFRQELKPDGMPYYGFPTIRPLDGTVIKP